MGERKILLFILSVIVYCVYSVHMWFMKQNVQANVVEPEKNEPVVIPDIDPKNETTSISRVVKTKAIPLFMKNACSVLEVFTVKPEIKCKNKMEGLSTDNNTVTVIGITVFLMILLIHAILEAIKVKEDERARRKLNPDGERRQSLAEFANKKPFVRRESNKFSQQLFQIAESFVCSSPKEEPKNRRQVRQYTRGESINSYLSETRTKPQEGSAPASVSEITTAERRLVKRQSVARLFGLSDD
ncbi:uncharacterized protein LOC142977925 isoform X2 [Anticarsia gemmatalis]|uniref:uncharacterized protein LOC142977925 isoform X2 n=1 Tax=Anticarsia gemmatalis TaxID=129554 RepID=UPI003F76A0CC